MATTIGIGTGSGIAQAPGVTVNEITGLTATVAGGASSTGAIAGLFRWGPVHQPTLIDNDEDVLAAKFGTPTNYNAETFFSAANFLAYGNALYVTRVGNTNDDLLSAVANTAAVVSFPAHTIENEDDYLVKKDSFEAGVQFIAKYPGDLGNSLRVSVITNANQYSSNADLCQFGGNTVFNGPNTGLTLTVGSNTATITLANTDVLAGDTPLPLAQSIANTITVGDYLEVGNTTTGVQKLKITTTPTITIANTSGTNTGIATIKLNLAEPLKLASNVSSNTLSRTWEFATIVGGAPKTSYSQLSANASVVDTMHIVVTDNDGKFSGRPGAVLEVFQNVSRATDATTVSGESNYYADVLNNGSNYLWTASSSVDIPVDTQANLTSTSDVTPFSVDLGGGSDGANEGAVEMAVLAKGWDIYKNDTLYDLAALIVGKTQGGLYGEQTMNYVIDNVAEARQEVVAYGSLAKTVVVNNATDIESDALNFRNAVRNTSYAALDSGYKWQYDKYNNVFRWIPLCGDAAGLSCRSDVTDSPAAAPAGLNRGQIKNIIKLAWNPTKAQMGVLFSNDINPVVNFAGEGTYLMGDKTLFGQANALDSIGVRKMLNNLKTAVAKAARAFVFENNDEFTQARFKSLVNPFLRDYKNRREIRDYEVICDDTNNTDQVIKDRRFVGDIKFLPQYAARYVTLNFAPVDNIAVFEEGIA
jgi:phage tail sheath protein FI